MKKILLIAISGVICAASANAQIQKGNVLVGGDIANFSLSLNSGSSYNIQIAPKAAWFVKDNLALGGFFSLGFAGSSGSATTTNYGIGGLGRYYVNDPTINVLKHTRFFLEANAGIQGVDVSKGGGNTNGLGIGFGPGIAYFITPNIGLEGLVKYNGLVGFGSDPYTSQLNLNVGFQIYLPGKSTMHKVKSDMK
jgi:hypothetical protein